MAPPAVTAADCLICYRNAEPSFEEADWDNTYDDYLKLTPPNSRDRCDEHTRISNPDVAPSSRADLLRLDGELAARGITIRCNTWGDLEIFQNGVHLTVDLTDPITAIGRRSNLPHELGEPAP